MEKRTKQFITGIAANVFSLPPIYFAFLHKGAGTNWKLIFISFLPLIVVLGGLRIIWGPEIFSYSIWREEGYSSFSEWFKKSQSLNGKFFRIIIKWIIPIVLAVTILFAAAIVIRIYN